jgi:translation initiation factor 4A
MASLTESTAATFSDWDEVPLKRSLLRGIYAVGFEKPSPIQQQAILPMIQKRDLLAQAQSGTGKTGAFCVSTIQICDDDVKAVQAIILSPTRELASQTHAVFQSLSFQTTLKAHLLIGGTSVDRDIRQIEAECPQVLVGCPGRVLDFLNRGVIVPDKIRLLVLDEADEILSSGFCEQIKRIFQFLTDSVQVAMFSATIPDELHDLVKKITSDPVKILVKSEMLTLEGIAQFYITFTNDNEKLDALKDLYEGISVSQSIIYCNSVRRVEDLYQALRAENFPVCCIHSEMDREQRNVAFQEFKAGKYRVMISSNLTSRGLDVQQVSIVINYDIPTCVHNYLHRIGRSGRWGRKGVGINFVTKYDIDRMRTIEKHYGTEMKELPSNYTELLA